MVSHKDQYFYEVQAHERVHILTLFNKYNFNHSLLTLTDTKTPSPVDAFFVSANTTNVFVEYKRRQILAKKYTDTFIERTKFATLYKLCQAGNYTLFIIEFDDYYFLFDLNQQFKQYQFSPNNFFCSLHATKSMYEYSPGQKEKQIRYMQLHEAVLIIDKNFQRTTWDQYISSI